MFFCIILNKKRSLKKKIFFKYSASLIVILLFFYACNNRPVDTISKNIYTVKDIQDIDTSVVKPYDYKSVISLNDLPVAEKKQKFIDMILPAILVIRAELKNTQNEVKLLIASDTSEISKKQKIYLYNLLKKYKANSFDDLLSKLNTHPNSIVLAQSAVESGWGTSRFFLEANNIFGVWSFSKNDNRIKANKDRNGKFTYLKKYSSLSKSIEDYFLTIARGPYSDFRLQRTNLKNPYKLVSYLLKYSELGEGYVKKLQVVIKSNDFTKYDNYHIDPKYLRRDNLSFENVEERFEFGIEDLMEYLQDSLMQDTVKHNSQDSIISQVKKTKEPKPQIEESITKSANNKDDTFKSDLPDFASIKNIAKKKIKFFEFMRPYINTENAKVLKEREFVIKMQSKFNENIEFTKSEKSKLDEMTIRYRIKNTDLSKVKTYNDLLLHVDIIPLQLALSQAALESAWGTSYFAREVNNIFGQWCFTPGCGVVPKRRPAGETHEVAKFENVSLSVSYYLQFLNSHPLFSKLRKTRLKNRNNDEEPNAYKMAGGLSAYSARGNKYVSELRSMINSNKNYMLAD